jgi:2-polyprenyl-3-methyl-5-hydroxy-6-metoxy-1,4-benzoquinol methylase
MKQQEKKQTRAIPAPCILCGKPPHHLVYQREAWQYFRCNGCGVVSLHPRPTPDDLLASYTTYLPDRADEIASWKKMIKPVVETAANLVDGHQHADGARLLDIGCGHGFFLEKMAQKGWTVEGIEVSGPGRNYAGKTLGLSVHSKPLEDMAFPEECFDVVTLFYVIEHVHDPGMILKEVFRILKPGGMVLLRWPHSTPVVKILGPFAQRLDIYHTPYHLYDFNPGAMQQLLGKSGFKEVQTMIGGFTLPGKRFYRWSSVVFGQMAEALHTFSGGRFLLPGVSKTSIGFKNE